MYTIQAAKKEIMAGIRGYLLKNEDGTYFYKETAKMPYYLEGKPGIGKTEIVKQVANELGIGFVSFSITHHTRNTLLGLPVIKEQEGCKYTEYTMSEIIAKVKLAELSGYKEGILLLDEFNCASETIYPMMLAMLQTRNIGYYKIPEGWNMVLCGNPKRYNKSARELDAAILDRVRKLEIEESTSEFLSYAKENAFHPIIRNYLEGNRVDLYHYNLENNKELVTCRGWENLSHALYAYEKLGEVLDVNLVQQFIKSEEIAESFLSYYQADQDGKLTRILENIDKEENWDSLVEELQEDIATLWCLVEQIEKGLEVHVRKKEEAVAIKKMDLVFRFLNRLPNGADLQEHFFHCINTSAVLKKVLLKKTSKEYMDRCRASVAVDIDNVV